MEAFFHRQLLQDPEANLVHGGEDLFGAFEPLSDAEFGFGLPIGEADQRCIDLDAAAQLVDLALNEPLSSYLLGYLKHRAAGR